VVAEASIAAGERNLRLRPVFLNKWTHLVNANVEISFARHAATASKLEIFEYMSAQGKTQTLGLTTEGLSQALEQLQSRCGVRRQPDAKPNASAKGR
jgi:hypothetical protein